MQQNDKECVERVLGGGGGEIRTEYVGMMLECGEEKQATKNAPIIDTMPPYPCSKTRNVW